jgi:hypothetical protein
MGQPHETQRRLKIVTSLPVAMIRLWPVAENPHARRALHRGDAAPLGEANEGVDESLVLPAFDGRRAALRAERARARADGPRRRVRTICW